MSEQQNTQQPVAWVRFCSDGCYEGPIMDSSARMDGSRRNSGAWTPLYTAPPVPRDVLMAFALEVKKACGNQWLMANERYKYEAIIGCDVSALADRYASQVQPEPVNQQMLATDDVQWVVNDNAELGVKIGSQFFWLYKGDSLVYESGQHDDGTPMMWRPVGKREFGECCYPVKFYKPGATLPDRYTDTLQFIPGISFGKPEDADWRTLSPAIAAAEAGSSQPVAQQYLLGGRRFKVTHSQDHGFAITGLPQTMNGQWVAFFDATDNCHMQQQPASAQPVAVPDGYVLVPVKLAKAVIDDDSSWHAMGYAEPGKYGAHSVDLAALLSAAQKPEGGE